MMDAHLSEEQVAICAEALNNRVLGNLPNNIQEHYNACEQCAHEVLAVAQVSKEVDRIPLQLKSKRSKSLVYWLSAAAMLAIFAGIGYYSVKPGDESEIASIEIPTEINDPSSQNKQIVAPAIEKPFVKAENSNDHEIRLDSDSEGLLAYASNEDMEKLVDRYRTGAMRGAEVEVISAIEMEGALNEITLEWKKSTNQKLLVEVFNNQGEKLFDETTADLVYKPEQITTKGLYYWKLINEDFDLIFCGKIRIQ